jgi:hypothetical protein
MVSNIRPCAVMSAECRRRKSKSERAAIRELRFSLSPGKKWEGYELGEREGCVSWQVRWRGVPAVFDWLEAVMKMGKQQVNKLLANKGILGA